MASDLKECASCGLKVYPGLLVCPSCGGGVFVVVKTHATSTARVSRTAPLASRAGADGTSAAGAASQKKGDSVRSFILGEFLRGLATVVVTTLILVTAGYWLSDRFYDWGLWPLGAGLRLVVLAWLVGVVYWLWLWTKIVLG